MIKTVPRLESGQIVSKKGEIDLFSCISTTNNVKSYTTIDKRAHSLDFQPIRFLQKLREYFNHASSQCVPMDDQLI